MMTSHNAGRSQDIALGIGDGQNVAGFGTFSRLVTHALPTLLGDSVTAIQVQPRQVQVGLNARNAVLPHPREAPISTPLPKVVIHRLPTDFFFVGSLGSAATGSSAH